VEIWGVGVMNLMAFSLLAYNNLEIDRNQEMELTIGSLNFHVRSLGSIHLSDPVRLDPLARETKTVARSKSSVGYSSEVNSPVSFTTTENSEGKIEELDETMGNLDLGGTKDQTYLSQKEFTTRSGLRKYALEAIIILLLSYFLFMIMFIFHARIVLRGNINTCVVYKQHRVPSTPLLD
jgi:hypothetical protein